MDTFLFVAVFLQMLFCSVRVTLFGEYIFILPILGYAILGELLKYTLSLMISAGEEMNPDSSEESRPMKQAEWAVEGSLTTRQAIPTVRNPLVWSFCKRLQIPARLEFPPHSVLLNTEDVPTVRKREVFVLCQALGLEAQLASWRDDDCREVGGTVLFATARTCIPHYYLPVEVKCSVLAV